MLSQRQQHVSRASGKFEPATAKRQRAGESERISGAHCPQGRFLLKEKKFAKDKDLEEWERKPTFVGSAEGKPVELIRKLGEIWDDCEYLKESLTSNLHRADGDIVRFRQGREADDTFIEKMLLNIKMKSQLTSKICMALKESAEFKEHADKVNICDDAAKVLQYLIQSTEFAFMQERIQNTLIFVPAGDLLQVQRDEP